MTKLALPVEATKSISGLHAARSVAIILNPDGSTKIVTKPTLHGHGTYKRGIAGLAEIEVPEGSLVVHAWLVLNSRGHVKGLFRVLNGNGIVLLEARLIRKKIRRLRGDPNYAWAIEKAVEVLGLEKHVRRYNWNTGAD